MRTGMAIKGEQQPGQPGAAGLRAKAFLRVNGPNQRAARAHKHRTRGKWPTGTGKGLLRVIGTSAARDAALVREGRNPG